MPHQFLIEEKDRLLTEAAQFLNFYRQSHTAKHCAAVAAQATQLAVRFDVDPIQAEIAGYLHDISAVIPTAKRVVYARTNGIPVLPEEQKAPMILHQKISVVICRDLFGIEDEAILSAVGCHTTLKSGASPLDKVVFLADKLAWDQEDEPIYLKDVQAALSISLDAAVLVYLNHLWAMRDTLSVVHPWFLDALADFTEQ